MMRTPTFLTRCGILLRDRIDRFRSDERGSVSIEMVLVVPMLFWCYLGMFVYFDAFRAKSATEKATFTIADFIGRIDNREIEDVVTPEIIDSMYELHGLLTHSRLRTGVRISVISWNANRGRYYRVWSEWRGRRARDTGGLRGVGRLTNTALISPEYTDRLPTTMLHTERLILVETFAIYEPPFNLAWDAFGTGQETFGPHIKPYQMDTLVFYRPRFSERICFNDDPNYDPVAAVC
ncbi:TadE/TadG family type IV pilus assembly protein [Aestuariibius sp. HNIBRBA575]|uniref:TadE/TadG family type IV pilus assembly protein n=1 Tax=Aestuariibius sp. HNIBRBA575 TaxID=3233343 RepID=UPI0034A2EBE3